VTPKSWDSKRCPTYTSNPDDWAKIAGRKGERIVAVKSLVGLTRQPQRNMEKVVTTGQYL
jgi:proteasome-associated ATPase